MPVPGVADRQQHVRPGPRIDVVARILVVELDVRGLDRDRATVRHRVASVDDDVHDDLFHLARVDPDLPEAVRLDQRQRDVLADQAAQHLLHTADDRVEVDDLRLEHLLPAECEQLSRQCVARLPAW